MAVKERKGSRRANVRLEAEQPGRVAGSAVTIAINRGFVIGREVLVGSVPGIVIGYNIAGVGRFLGSAYPLVVRTALGVTKCALDELRLA
jgi:hypothetical protein